MAIVVWIYYRGESVCYILNSKIMIIMRLSKNFTYEEFIRSCTAERMGIDNRTQTKEEEKKVIENLRNRC